MQQILQTDSKKNASNLLENLLQVPYQCLKRTNLLISQNHRVVEVEGHLSSPWLKQGHLEVVAHSQVQTAFQYLQAWRLRSLTGQLVLCARAWSPSQ